MKQIGSGAYGVVVSALDRTTNKKYAIKKVFFALILGIECIWWFNRCEKDHPINKVVKYGIL